MNLKRTLLAGALILSASVDARAIVGRSEDADAFADRIVMVLSRGAEGSGFCTGVVLTRRIVLTAAHCLRGPSDTLVFYRDGAGEPVTAPVVATKAHPLYRADAIARRVVSIDLGLLEIATPLPDTFHPAELGDRGVEVGEAVTTAGFGVAREGEPKSGGSPRAAALRVREPASKVLLWAEDPDHAGSGACAGDSGAPIFAADQRAVLALVAWTAGAKGHKCGVLTQGPLIAPVRDWIEGVLADWNR
jgi:hypothetical protein